MKKVRILLADDHRIMSEALSTILQEEFDVIEIVEDGRALVEAALRLRPEVIISDISMPELNGIDAVHQLRERGFETKVVFLTMHPDISYIAQALDAGASGFLLKSAAVAELVEAVHQVLRGQAYLPAMFDEHEIGELMMAMQRQRQSRAELTPRRREVLQQLAEGKSAKEAAVALGISSRTVEFHKYGMMKDLGISSHAELVQYAIKTGIVSL